MARPEEDRRNEISMTGVVCFKDGIGEWCRSEV
jgi:hypothetical protein